MATTRKPRTRTVGDPRLKQYLDAKKHPTILVGEVSRFLQKRKSTRDTTVIHPSEMAKKNWCPRATWHRLMMHEEVLPTKPNAFRSELIFAEGHAIHEKWQGWLTEMDVLYGMWSCRYCRRVEMAWSNSLDAHCPGGSRRHDWVYQEVPLHDPVLRIRGSADGVFFDGWNDHPDAVMLEIKSVGPGTMRALNLLGSDDSDEYDPSLFSRISRPTADHVRQLQIYMRLWQNDSAHRMSGGGLERGLIVYEQKSNQAVKEFQVNYSPNMVDDRFDSAARIVDAIKVGYEVECPYGGCAECRVYDGA